jgi:hypothetical protein
MNFYKFSMYWQHATEAKAVESGLAHNARHTADNFATKSAIAILNHLRNYCRGNPPVVAPIDKG